MGIENFIASEGWFHRWKKFENIVYKRTYGEQKDTVLGSRKLDKN
jgi:hypothetical protein